MAMGKIYNQLNIDDREMIAVLKAQGKSARQIGKAIGRSHSTVVRELKRNSAPIYKCWYLSHKAEERARERKRLSGVRARLKSEGVRYYVEKKLKCGWSPEQIAGRLKRLKPEFSVSHEAIYQYVYTEARYLIPFLARGSWSRRKRGHSRKHRKSHIPNRTGIDMRPSHVDSRKEFGHWETDSVVSRASKPVLNVLVERKSRFTKITKLKGKTSKQTRMALNRRLCRHPEGARLSITYDNGSENVEHEKVNKTLGTLSYFCNPYHSWEKGTVENTAGLIRRYVPKKTDISKIADAHIKWMERQLNNRPRKCLDYQTPAEVFDKLCGALAG